MSTNKGETEFILTVAELRALLDQCNPSAHVLFAWAGGVSEIRSDTFLLDTESGALIVDDGSAFHPEQKNGKWKLLK